MAATDYRQLRDQEDYPLVLLQRPRLDMNRYPIVLTNHEETTINMDHVLSVIQQRTRSPSAIAGLDHARRPAIILRVDDMFDRAQEEYRSLLRRGIRSDRRNLDLLDRELAREVAPYRFPLALRILFFFMRNTCRNLTERLEQAIDHLSITTRHAQSAHRRAAMIRIDTLEKRRLNETGDILVLRMLVLVTELQEMIRGGETDIEKEEELRSIWQVFITLFPDREDEEVNNISISSFLEQLNGEE